MSERFEGTISDKPISASRLMLPKEYRDKFAIEADSTVLITIGPRLNIALYPYDNWDKLYKILSKGTLNQKKLLGDMRIYAMAPQQLEGPGRFRISKELLEFAGIDEKVSFVGEGSFISIWNPDKLQQEKLSRLTERNNRIEETDYQLEEESDSVTGEE